MCDRRLQQTTVNLRSAEEYYNYGVALLNTRTVVEARGYLEKALQMSPGPITYIMRWRWPRHFRATLRMHMTT
jgi:hypothetical protein